MLYGLLQAVLRLVYYVNEVFEVFAGTEMVTYEGEGTYLINVFFSNTAVTNAFWAMALIGMAVAFAAAIVGVSRSITDMSGTLKSTVSSVMGNFVRCITIIIMMNLVVTVTVYATNIVLERINYALENASVLHLEDGEKTFTNAEYALMAKILSTVANYNANDAADSRYNVNSCFNAIRGDLATLQQNDVFEYGYELDANGQKTWQGALATLAAAAPLTTELQLSTYYPNVADAIAEINQLMDTYVTFYPSEYAVTSSGDSIGADVLLFFIATGEAANNTEFNSGNFYDSLHIGYITGDKDYMTLSQVRSDFDIWLIDYFVCYIAGIVYIIIMALCIFTAVTRLFNLVVLYIAGPLYVSVMPLDDGSKYNAWLQSFVIQLFSGMGAIFAMRVYLIMLPIMVSNDLVFFDNKFLNQTAQMFAVLAGAWAVMKGTSLFAGIMSGNPGMAAAANDAAQSAMVTGAAMRMGSMGAKVINPVNIAKAPATAMNKIREPFRETRSSYRQGFHHEGYEGHRKSEVVSQRYGGGSGGGQADGGAGGAGGAGDSGGGGSSAIPQSNQISGGQDTGPASSGVSAKIPMSSAGDSGGVSAKIPMPSGSDTGKSE